MKTLLFFIAILVFIVILIPIIKAKLKTNEGSVAVKVKVKAKPLLTENELEFLNRLEEAAPQLRFHAQTGMGAILQPAISKKDDARLFMSIRGTFSQNLVDFVAQKKDTGEIVALIELDDRTHNIEKDQKRDTLTAEAGYRTIRWDSRKKPTIEEIRKTLIAGGASDQAQIKH